MGIFKGKKTSEETTKSAKKDEKKTVKAKETKKDSMKDLYKDENKAVAKKTSTDKDVKKGTKRGIAYKILVKPLITEKAATMSAENKYVFEIDEKANKIEVADSVEEVYGVRPVAVNVLKVKGKTVRYGRTVGKRKDWKKAVVTLPEGKSINIYEGV